MAANSPNFEFMQMPLYLARWRWSRMGWAARLAKSSPVPAPLVR